MAYIPSPNELDFEGIPAVDLDFGQDQGTTLSSPIEDLFGYSNSTESVEDDQDQSRPTKKRVRTTTVLQACLTCRKRHRKCDGNQPVCALCDKKGLPCTWDTKRAKRGPKKGQTKGTIESLQSTIESLSSVISTAARAAGQPASPVSLSPFEKLLNDRVLVDTYLNVYHEHVYPLLLNPPSVDHNSPFLAPGRKLYLTSLLVVGAQCLDHPHYEKQFLQNARTMMGDLFDSVDPYVAASYGVLSGYYNSVGSIDKAYVMNTTACSIVEELSKKQKRLMAGKPSHLHPPKCDGIDLVELHITLLQDRLDYIEPGAASDLIQTVSTKITEAESYSDPETIYLLRGCMNCISSSTSIIEDTQNANITDRGIASQVVLGLTEISRKLPAKFWKPATVNRMQLMATAFSSAVWLVCSQFEDARRTAEESLELMRKLGTPYRDITCLAAFYIVCQVFMVLEETEKYYHCLEYLQEIGRTHGLGLLALQSLERIRMSRQLIAQQSDARVFKKLRILSVFELQAEADSGHDVDNAMTRVNSSSSNEILEAFSQIERNDENLMSVADSTSLAHQTPPLSSGSDDILYSDSNQLQSSLSEIDNFLMSSEQVFKHTDFLLRESGDMSLST